MWVSGWCLIDMRKRMLQHYPILKHRKPACMVRLLVHRMVTGICQRRSSPRDWKTATFSRMSRTSYM